LYQKRYFSYYFLVPLTIKEIKKKKALVRTIKGPAGISINLNTKIPIKQLSPPKISPPKEY